MVGAEEIEKRNDFPELRPELRRALPLALLVVATAILTFVVVPDISVDSSTEDVEVFKLGNGSTPRQAVTSGSLTSIRRPSDPSLDDFPASTVGENIDGYTIRDRASGTVELPLRVRLDRGERAFVELWAYGGPSLRTTAEVRASDGSGQVLGSPGQGAWGGKLFDVTAVAREGRFVLRVAARNDGDASALFFDQVALVHQPSGSRTSASAALIALWLGLIAGAVLQLWGRLRRHWPLPLLVLVAGFAFWVHVDDADPFRAPPAWTLARGAGWLDLHSGLLSGSFGEVSALTVQLFHALMPLTGAGAAGAVAASAFIGVAAVAALYALGNRVAGRLAAVVTVLLALVVGPFRDAAAEGGATTTMILAATLFAYALHASLAETNLPAVSLLAAAGTLAVLANSVWLPGILICIPLCALLYAPRGDRLRIAGLGLLIFALLLAPNRAGVADQHEGNLIADVDARATEARNLENFLEHRPIPSDAVNLGAYIFSGRSTAEVLGNSFLGSVRAVGSFAEVGGFPILAALGFVLSLFGALYLLLVSRLRSLVILTLLIALPEFFFAGALPQFFFAGEEVFDPFAAGAAIWPMFLVGGGLFAFVLFAAYGDRFIGPLRQSGWVPFGRRQAASDEAATVSSRSP